MRAKPFRILAFLVVVAFLGTTRASLSAPEDVYLSKPYQRAFEISYRMASVEKYDEAIKPLMTLYKQDPSDYTVVLRMGYLNYLKGDYSTSVSFYERAVKLSPKAIEPRMGLILPLMAKRDYKSVVAVGTSALSLDPGNYTCLSKLAYSYYLLGGYKNAAKYYKKILDLYPADVTMRGGLGWTYLKAGEKAKAKKEFAKVLLLSPNDQSALFGYRKAK